MNKLEQNTIAALDLLEIALKHLEAMQDYITDADLDEAFSTVSEAFDVLAGEYDYTGEETA